MQIENLRALNLSDNPLEGLQFDNWKHRLLDYSFQFNSLKLREVEFTEKLVRDMCPLVEKVTSLDISGSYNLKLVVDSFWEGVYEGSVSFTNLEVLKIGNVMLSEVSIQRLINVFQETRKHRCVDLRGCEHNSETG